ncbi:MAG: TrkH family potassium uptake protein [Bacteroidaceae bacterium]|nr:TrkH family potassium uptake protein [Bacteroidaceae bacterium]
MINWRLIAKIIGILLYIEAGLMVLCQIVAFIYNEGIEAFCPPIFATILLGVIGHLIGRNAGANMGRKDGYVVVSLVWVVFTIIGMFPFLISGTIPDVSSAFFETMSGFTSTGATIIDDIDSLPRSLLFWRSLTQWIGGIGIVFFTIAILPAFGVGEVKLFAAESTGPLHDKVHPRISMAAKWIGSVYVMLTVLCIFALLLCGMDTFDAINYSMCTTATGGYGTHSALLHEAFDNSATIEYVLTFFMFTSGVNYTLIYYTILKGRIKQFLRDAEVRCYYIIVLIATAVCTITLFYNRGFSDFELSFRESIFTVISLQTTTGLATCDYTLWPVQLMPILLFVMFAGACSGSTSGGFKCARMSIIYRVLKNEFTRILHPRAVIPVRMNDVVIPQSIVQTLLGFITLFVLGLFGGAFVLALFGVSPNDVHPDFDYYEAFGLAMSSISNVGPGMGYYGPANSWAILSPFAKWVCSFLMLIGRLEIFPIIILFTPNFWKKG